MLLLTLVLLIIFFLLIFLLVTYFISLIQLPLLISKSTLKKADYEALSVVKKYHLEQFNEKFKVESKEINLDEQTFKYDVVASREQNLNDKTLVIIFDNFKRKYQAYKYINATTKYNRFIIFDSFTNQGFKQNEVDASKYVKLLKLITNNEVNYQFDFLINSLFMCYFYESLQEHYQTSHFYIEEALNETDQVVDKLIYHKWPTISKFNYYLLNKMLSKKLPPNTLQQQKKFITYHKGNYQDYINQTLIKK